MKNACSAYRQEGICSNGFPQNAACLGVVCHLCNRQTNVIPACQSENLGEPWIDAETGAPRLHLVKQY